MDVGSNDLTTADRYLGSLFIISTTKCLCMNILKVSPVLITGVNSMYTCIYIIHVGCCAVQHQGHYLDSFRFLAWTTCSCILGEVLVWCSFMIEIICCARCCIPWARLCRMLNYACKASPPCSPWNPMPNPHLRIHCVAWSSRKWCLGRIFIGKCCL